MYRKRQISQKRDKDIPTITTVKRKVKTFNISSLLRKRVNSPSLWSSFIYFFEV
jgi:hypothetical protein